MEIYENTINPSVESQGTYLATGKNDGISNTNLELFFEKANNSSKVVDENGEPKVMYRGDDYLEENCYVSGLFVSDKDNNNISFRTISDTEYDPNVGIHDTVRRINAQNELDVDGVRGKETYYDHHLTQIEKGKLIDSRGPVATGLAEDKSAFPKVKNKRLISILKEYFSKIINENCEPEVVGIQAP